MVEEIILDEKKLNKLADHLISPVGVPIRNATLVDQGNKDVLFFKGSTDALQATFLLSIESQSTSYVLTVYLNRRSFGDAHEGCEGLAQRLARGGDRSRHCRAWQRIAGKRVSKECVEKVYTCFLASLEVYVSVYVCYGSYMFRGEKVETGKVRTATRGIRSFDKDGFVCCSG